MKQFKNYKSPRRTRQPHESAVSKILWFVIEHAVSILLVIILIIIWMVISL